MSQLAGLHDTSSRLLFAVAGMALCTACALYLYEVAARYLFDAPTTWTNEAVQYSLAMLIFLALPDITRRAAHIAIDIVPASLSGGPAIWLARLNNLVAAGACLFAGWIAFGEAAKQFDRGLLTNAAHPIPRWWITAVITLGLASAAMHFLRHAMARDERLATRA